MDAVLHFFKSAGQFLWDHQDVLIALLPLLLAWLRSSKRGKRVEQVLIKVAGAIEAVDDKELKADVSSRLETAHPAEKEILDHVVDIVDVKKTPKGKYDRLLIELSRMLMPKGAK
jgi:hypothetical protein